jgi:2'-5' RNA ligase
MAMVGIRVPQDAARLLASVEVPGEKVQRSHSHVTLLMLGDDVPIEEIGKAIVAVYGVAEKTVPFRVAVNSVSTFKGGDNGVPVICPIFAPKLEELHDNLKAALDEAGIEYSKKFPEYRPHVTLSYSPEPMKDMPLGPLEWSCFEVVLWGGDEGDERLSTTFPFALPGKTALWRKLVRANIRMGDNAPIGDEDVLGKGTSRGWETRREREEKVVREIEMSAPHLLHLWKKLKSQFKGEPEERAQKFIEYVQEHDGEEMGILQDYADREVKRLIKELEKKHLDEPPPASFRHDRYVPSPVLPEPEDWIPFSAAVPPGNRR